MYKKQNGDSKFNKIFYNLLSHLDNEPDINEVDNVVTYLVQISKSKQINDRDIGDFDRLNRILQIEHNAIIYDIQNAIKDQKHTYHTFERLYTEYEVKIVSKLEEYNRILADLKCKETQLVTARDSLKNEQKTEVKQSKQQLKKNRI